MDVVVTEQSPGVAIIAPRDRVDAFTADGLRERLEELLSASLAHFVVDLSGVTFLDSAGLAVLVSLLKRARLAGGDVSLVWPNAMGPRRVLQLTKFDRVFHIAPTAEAALGQLSG